jgi:hypothetical protein
MKNLSYIKFTEDELNLLCAIINNFGTDQHPIADENSINFFTIDYVKELIETEHFIKAKSKMNSLGKNLLKSINNKLK